MRSEKLNTTSTIEPTPDQKIAKLCRPEEPERGAARQKPHLAGPVSRDRFLVVPFAFHHVAHSPLSRTMRTPEDASAALSLLRVAEPSPPRRFDHVLPFIPTNGAAAVVLAPRPARR